MFKGREVRKLVLVSTICCVLLVVSVSLFLIINSRNHLRNQTDQMKTAMAEQIAVHLQACYEDMLAFLQSDEGVYFGSGIKELLKNKQSLYNFFTNSILWTYGADYIKIYSGSEMAASLAAPGLAVPPELAPGIAGGDEYVILDELGGRTGTFLVFEKEGLFPSDTAVYTIDNTEQTAAIKQAYDEEKSAAIKQQALGVGILFLLVLALSLLVIGYAIKRWLGRPIAHLSDEARMISRGEAPRFEDVREGSLFANLQRLLNSGRAILEKGTVEGEATGMADNPVGNREVNKVIAVWAAVTTLIFLASTIVMLVVSIALTNNKTEEILEKVDQEMADYYNGCYDSIVGAGQVDTDIYIGKDMWNPDAAIDLEASIQRMVDLMRISFNADTTGSHIDPPGGGKYLVSSKEGVVPREYPVSLGEPTTIHQDYYEPGDMVIETMNPTRYPGMGDNQFVFYTISVTPQTDVLESLYREGADGLLVGQLVLSLVFLLLCLALSPLAMAWATRQYITRPILELDAISERLMEGDLDSEIRVDEKSAFADIQRLLKRAQELLRSI